MVKWDMANARIPAEIVPVGKCIKCKVRLQYFGKLCKVCYKHWLRHEPKTWARYMFEKSSGENNIPIQQSQDVSQDVSPDDSKAVNQPELRLQANH